MKREVSVRMRGRTRWAVREPDNWFFSIVPAAETDEFVLEMNEGESPPPEALRQLPFSRPVYDSLLMFSDRVARLGFMGYVHLSVDGDLVILRYTGPDEVDFADWDGTILKIDRQIFRQAMEVADLARKKP